MSHLKSWAKDGLTVLINDHSPYIDVIAKYNYREFKLLLEYSHDSAFIEDIQGNNYDSGLQGKGIGSLLVNTAIQVLRKKLPIDSLISGQMSDVGDPIESVLLKRCQQHRSAFWASFGFNIQPGMAGHEKIRALLSDLKVKENGLTLDKFPRFIPLSDFVEQE
ncbi:hypothetical protein [Rheinheimera sp.]|uniref:hypothetical protein n=1 Tax=Rheinheimera sp. TaxID=1869214 RepID=UPI002736A7A1|nr:hypothetical protein [Rheinheimera sp.]MDP2716650.1 hypothetical protein [Rheinheimera sp.]